MNEFNGLPVLRRNDDTIFIPLPRSAWKEVPGGCCCQYCSSEDRVQRPGFWDTLAITSNPKRHIRADTTWTVHYPELHGAKPKRSTP